MQPRLPALPGELPRLSEHACAKLSMLYALAGGKRLKAFAAKSTGLHPR